MLIELTGAVGIGLYARARLHQKKGRLVKVLTNRSPSVMPFMGDVRNQQLQEFSAGTLEGKSREQELTDRNMMMALTSMGLAIAGKLFYWPLALLSLPGILYLTQYSVVHTYKKLLKERKLTVDLLSAANKVFFLFNGYLALAGFSVALFSVNLKLLNKISNDSKKSIIDVFELQQDSVWVVVNGIEREIAFTELETGDVVVVSAGGTIPADGVICEGSAAIDQHILTGESQPVEKSQGEEVFAMTLVLSGKIYIKTHKTGQETTAAQIANILNNTVSTKTDFQLRTQEMTDKTVLPTIVLCAMALPFLGLTGAIVIINSHFKYRATIASSIGVLNYLNTASHNGILMKDGHTFELLKSVDTVVFDKTGTLTEEQPRVARIHVSEGYSEHTVLRYAAAAEAKQSHPIARAILQYATDQQVELPEVEESAYKLGYGLTVSVEGQIIRVGSLRFLEQEGIPISESIRQVQAHCHAQGLPLVAVALADAVIGVIELEATIREGTKKYIDQLRERGITSMYIISGDHEAPTRKIAQELGIDHYFAETLPEQKAELIAKLQSEGKNICYIGDGINDSIALQQANVSISIRGASTVATDVAQIVLMDKTLQQLPYLFDMGQQFDGHMKKVVAAVVVPSLVSVGGAIFLHIGLLQSFLLPQLGLIAGVAMAMRPRIKHQTPKTRTGVIKSAGGIVK
jgi:Cu2+-exporting ATPase